LAIEIPQTLIYRLPRALYRRGNLDQPLIYRGLWGPVRPGPLALSQPLRSGLTLRFYNREDILHSIVSSNAQRCQVIALRFELLETGCGLFDLTLGEPPSGIGQDFRCDVHLWNSSTPIYSGFINRLPGAGTTERNTNLQGFGGMALLDRVYITQTYEAQSVRSIVLDVIRQAEQRVRVTADQSQVDAISYSTQGQIKFLRTPIKTALKQLASLAGGYSWGIDANRKFFFRAPSTEVDLHAWTGKHLETYIANEDYSEIVTRLYVKAGKVRSDLAPTETFYKTNWVPDQIDDKDAQATYEIREGEYSAPSVLNLVDALQAGFVELQKLKAPRRFATVSGMEFSGTPLTATGYARITGTDGSQLTYPKKRLRYSLDGSRVRVDLELGDIDPSPGDLVAQLNQHQAAESLARQNSQQQI